MRDFREILSFCEVHDLGFSVMPWKTSRGQECQSEARQGGGDRKLV
jgi:hypothetical protein